MPAVNDNTKIPEEKSIVPIQVDATQENSLVTQKKLDAEHEFEVSGELTQFGRNASLNPDKTKEECSILQIQNENMLTKTNQRIKSVKIFEIYHIKATMLTIVDHPVLDKLIKSHMPKSETDLISKPCPPMDARLLLRESSSLTHKYSSEKYAATELETTKNKIEAPEKTIQDVADEDANGVIEIREIQLRQANEKIAELTEGCRRYREQIEDLKNNKSNLEKLNWSLDNRVEVLIKGKEEAMKELETTKTKLAAYEKISQPDISDNKVQAKLSGNIPLPQQSKQTDVKPGTTMEEMDESETTSMNVPHPDVKKKIAVRQSNPLISTHAQLKLLNIKLIGIVQELIASKRENHFVTILHDTFHMKHKMLFKNDLLNEEIKILKKKIVAFEKQVNADKVKYERSQANLLETQSELKKERESFSTKLHENRLQRDRLLRTIAEYVNKITTLSEANNKLTIAKRKLEEEKRKTGRKITELNSENKSLKIKIDEDSLRIRRDILSSKRVENELNKMIKKLTVEVHGLKTTNHEYCETIKKFEEQISELPVKINDLEDESRPLFAEKRQLESALEDTKEKLRIEERAHMKSLKSVEREKQQLFYELTLENCVLETENKILCESIKTQQDAICKERATAAEYKTELNWQRHEVTKLKIEREIKEACIQDCLGRIKDLNNELEGRGNLRVYQIENEHMKSKLKVVESKLLQSLINENVLRKVSQEMNNKIANFKSIVGENIRLLDAAQFSFIRNPPPPQEYQKQKLNLADKLSMIKTTLLSSIKALSEPSKSQTNVTQILANLRRKENELAQLKQKIGELDARYSEVSSKLQAMKSTSGSETSTQDNTTHTESLRDSTTTSSGIDTDDTLEDYKSNCDYLTKRVKQLEREKQKLQAHALQLSEGKLMTDLQKEHAVLKNKFERMQGVAVMRLAELRELKSRFGFDPGQGRSTES